MSEGDWETAAWGVFCENGYFKTGSPHNGYAFAVYLEQFKQAWSLFCTPDEPKHC